MPTPGRPLAERVQISTRFHRSVHVERDALSPEALNGYRPTASAYAALERVLAGLAEPGGARAWSLTGPYGSGKSSFVTLLVALLSADRRSARARKCARALLDPTPPRLPKLLPVLVTGERQALGRLLLCALDRALDRGWPGRRRPAALKKIADPTQPASTRAVVQAFERAHALLVERRIAGGLLLVLDEADAPLAYAAQHPSEADVLLLQELAELAARRDPPFVFITVLHHAFAGHAARLGPIERGEWDKVQGRFEELAFVDGWEQTLRLLADAIELDERESRLIARARGQVRRALACLALPATVDPAEIEALCVRALPLHPFVALLLGPLLCSGVFQARRSLASFLVSREPGGLQQFMRAQRIEGELPLYRLAHLYDYIDNVLRARAGSSRPHALNIAELALQRVPESAGPLAAELVKSVALIAWLGERLGLRADQTTLAAGVSADEAAVAAGLATLVEASVITFRRFRGSYIVWEGSDLRLDELLARAAAVPPSSERAAAMLAELAAIEPLVAHQHLDQTGTLRYFPVRFIGAEQIVRFTADAGDGSVVVVILQSADQRQSAIATIAQINATDDARPILWVIPHEPWRLLDPLGQAAALDQLVRSEPQLRQDPVAQREVEARHNGLAQLIRSAVDDLVGLGAAAAPATWLLDGRERSITSARQLSRLLSDACDRAYGRAPILHDDQINRSTLSTAAASARRKLITAMLESPEREFFGCSAALERSLYASLFAAPHRLHGPHEGAWALREPADARGTLGPAWHGLRAQLAAAPERRLALTTIYDWLESPPYGLRRGVTPILFLHFCRVNAANLAIYEDAAFVPRLTAAVSERLLKSPRQFQLQWYPIDEARRELLRALGRSLRVSPRPGRDAPTVLQLVKELVRRHAELPRHARLTRRLSPSTVALRETLAMAAEPAPLLFEQLPRALGYPPFLAADARPEVDEFAAALADGLAELGQAYDALLDQLEASLAEQLGASGPAVHHQLAQRAARLLPHAVVPSHRAFLRRLADDHGSRREWLVGVASSLARTPPEAWADPELAVFQTELTRLARAVLELEALAGAQLPAGDGAPRRLVRVAIAELGAAYRERVIPLDAAEQPRARQLRGRLERLLDASADQLGVDVRLAALTSLTANLIAEAERDRSP